MKSASKFLVAAVAVAGSAVLLAAQGPPQERPGGGFGPPQDRPQFRQGMGPGGGGQMGRMGRHMGRGGMGMHHGRGMRRGMRMHRGAGLGLMLRDPGLRERIGVTEEQAEKIRSQQSAFLKSRIQTQTDVRVKRMELAELMAADNPDRAKIEQKMRAINEATFASQMAAVDHHLAMRNALTPEQKENLKQWQQERRQQSMERRRGPRGPRPPVDAPQPPEQQPEL